MEFEFSEKVQALRARVQALHGRARLSQRGDLHAQLAGAADRWQPVPIVQELKQDAKARGCGTCSWPTASAAPA